MAAWSNLHSAGLGVSKLRWVKQSEEMAKILLCQVSVRSNGELGKIFTNSEELYLNSILCPSFILAISLLNSRKEKRTRSRECSNPSYFSKTLTHCNLCSEQPGHCNDLPRWRTEAEKCNASCPRPPWIPSVETEIKLRSAGSQSWGLTMRHSLFFTSDNSGWIGQYLPLWNTARLHAGKNRCEKRQGKSLHTIAWLGKEKEEPKRSEIT